jgi:hypothetical protein
VRYFAILVFLLFAGCSSKGLVWTGNSPKYPEVANATSFGEAVQIVRPKISQESCPSSISSQGEFEKSEAYQKRKETFRKKKEECKARNQKAIENEKGEILNSWLGRQSISMKYRPDDEVFDVTVNSIPFQIAVPIAKAESFKGSVKQFDMKFEERNGELWIVGASAEKYSSKFEIPFEIVIIGNLMFLKHLQNAMTWKDANRYCENLHGFTDWKLPNHEELKIFQNRNRFRNLQNLYWTSTSSYLIGASYGSGNSSNSEKYHTLCVRNLD